MLSSHFGRTFVVEQKKIYKLDVSHTNVHHDRIIFYWLYLGLDPLWSFEAIIHIVADQRIKK